jgi:hypothetical protein
MTEREEQRGQEVHGPQTNIRGDGNVIGDGSSSSVVKIEKQININATGEAIQQMLQTFLESIRPIVADTLEDMPHERRLHTLLSFLPSGERDEILLVLLFSVVREWGQTNEASLA